MTVENGTQTLLEMCATCAHTKASHPEDGPCIEAWTVEDGKREVRCRCSEYWARRRDIEDGMPVTERQVGFGGSVDLELDRRVTSEFWDGLKQGRTLNLLVRVTVSGKAFREKDYSLRESRKLRAEQVYFVLPGDLERKRVVDVYGNEVDPETGEIVGD